MASARRSRRRPARARARAPDVSSGSARRPGRRAGGHDVVRVGVPRSWMPTVVAGPTSSVASRKSACCAPTVTRICLATGEDAPPASSRAWICSISRASSPSIRSPAHPRTSDPDSACRLHSRQPGIGSIDGSIWPYRNGRRVSHNPAASRCCAASRPGGEMRAAQAARGTGGGGDRGRGRRPAGDDPWVPVVSAAVAGDQVAFVDEETRRPAPPCCARRRAVARASRVDGSATPVGSRPPRIAPVGISRRSAPAGSSSPRTRAG